MSMILSQSFYTEDALLVAPRLLGKTIVRRLGDSYIRCKIVEVEAYINKEDDAAHFHKGLTDRTRIMDEVGGHLYIYNIYGIYQCLNIVAEKKGVHGGNLIRALEPLEGLEDMYENRYKKEFIEPGKKEIINLTNGPAKLVMAYGITKKDFYGADLVSDPRIWLEDGEGLDPDQIVRTTRINIDYAEKAKDYLLRFYIGDNPFVSKK